MGVESYAAATFTTFPLDRDRAHQTSITIPCVEERPAKQWPPQRTATSLPIQRAKAIVVATSVGRLAADDRFRSQVVKAGDGGLAHELIVRRARRSHIARDRALQRLLIGKRAHARCRYALRRALPSDRFWVNISPSQAFIVTRQFSS